MHTIETDRRTIRACFGLLVVAQLTIPLHQVHAGTTGKKPSLVKIWTVASAADPLAPSQRLPTEKLVGSGVIIDGHRILTNAHVVANQVSIEVQLRGTTRRYEASVEHVGHECDLALVSVKAKEFFSGTRPAQLGTLPKVKDQVTVHGFPVGGASASVTSGIVSRIEVSPYAHSREELLLVQIDAAINPGNSGGPVLADGKLVGIATQELEDAENVGYIVPPPVIRHFLLDVSDGRFDGFPNMDLDMQSLENPALRKSLKLVDGDTGALIVRLNHGGSGHEVLLPGDVILSIGEAMIGEDLTIGFGDRLRLHASYAFHEKQVGETITVEIIRNGERKKVLVQLRNTPLLIPGPQYDRQPDHLIFGGLVFQAVTEDYIDALDDESLWEHLAYYDYTQYHRTAGREQLIVVSRVLAAPLNRGYHDVENAIVESVQGVMPRNMEHLAELISSASGARLEVIGEDDTRIVLDLELARKQSRAIQKRYGISSE